MIIYAIVMIHIKSMMRLATFTWWVNSIIGNSGVCVLFVALLWRFFSHEDTSSVSNALCTKDFAVIPDVHKVAEFWLPNNSYGVWWQLFKYEELILPGFLWQCFGDEIWSCFFKNGEWKSDEDNHRHKISWQPTWAPWMLVHCRQKLSFFIFAGGVCKVFSYFAGRGGAILLFHIFFAVKGSVYRRGQVEHPGQRPGIFR